MHSLLVASSSALAAHRKLLGARAARSPTTARRCALGSSARAARSPATARRTLLGARAARSPPRRLALRARPSRLVTSSSVEVRLFLREVGPA